MRKFFERERLQSVVFFELIGMMIAENEQPPMLRRAMTRPLSLSEFSPIRGTQVPNGSDGDVDKGFAADIQHALEEQANQAPTRRSADDSSNGKNGAATPTPSPPRDAS